jgi:hypothetical protein
LFVSNAFACSEVTSSSSETDLVLKPFYDLYKVYFNKV